MNNDKNKVYTTDLFYHFGRSSQNIIQNHHRDNLSEFVLHDVCSSDLFNVSKGAYFVNNPDFACLKGVAGYHQPELFTDHSWSNPKEFTSHMKNAAFNTHVRKYTGRSVPVTLAQKTSHKDLFDIIDYLEIEKPVCHAWLSKHNNQGIFIYEGASDIDHEGLYNFLHLLSFCPIF